MDYAFMFRSYSHSKGNGLLRSKETDRTVSVNDFKRNFLITERNLKIGNNALMGTDDILRGLSEIRRRKEKRSKEHLAQNTMRQNRMNILDMLGRKETSKQFRKDIHFRNASNNIDNNRQLYLKRSNDFSRYNRIISSLDLLKKKL